VISVTKVERTRPYAGNLSHDLDVALGLYNTPKFAVPSHSWHGACLLTLFAFLLLFPFFRPFVLTPFLSAKLSHYLSLSHFSPLAFDVFDYSPLLFVKPSWYYFPIFGISVGSIILRPFSRFGYRILRSSLYSNCHHTLSLSISPLIHLLFHHWTTWLLERTPCYSCLSLISPMPITELSAPLTWGSQGTLTLSVEPRVRHRWPLATVLCGKLGWM